MATVEKQLNTIQLGDCIAGMNGLEAGSIDLAFADPPFNIGYDYDVYKDKLGREKYLAWSREWISAVYRVLKQNGTFWLAIGDEYAAELKVLSQDIGFHTRSWVVWYYTFGVNCKYKFTRSHAHIFYFVKDPDDFTFRSEDLENRIPSARELVYNDKRANPKGRLPDDTWIIRPANIVGEIISDDGTWSPEDLKAQGDTTQSWTLRPQDIENCFQANEDTWYFPRVAGTFKERQGFHGCQMPEQLLGRIIRSCSEDGDTVLDPFSGSATTLAVAKKLNRRFLGFELSEDYVAYGRNRLESIRIGDPLDGSAEPTKSAPKTNAIKRKKASDKSARQGELLFNERLAETQLLLTLNGVAEAFRLTHDGFSVDRVIVDPEANSLFGETCQRLGLAGDIRSWNTMLLRLRASGELSHIEITRKTELSWDQLDQWLHGSEMACQSMLNEGLAGTLDEILCDPLLVQMFDERAQSFVPGFRPLEYRWAAVTLKRQVKVAHNRGAVLDAPTSLGRPIPIDNVGSTDFATTAGVYLLQDGSTNEIYAGGTLNLRQRIEQCFETRDALRHYGDRLSVQVFPTTSHADNILAWQCCFVQKYLPQLNYRESVSE